MSWTTFKGKEVSFDTIDHQHMSNCYWSGRIIKELSIGDPHLEYIKDKLGDRFNGQLLPYRPHVEFEREIDYLRENMMLVEFTYHTEIWFEGRLIGEIILPE